MNNREIFDNHWKNFISKDLSSQKKEVAKVFLKPIIDKINNSEKILRVLDFGCGNGVHAEVLHELVNTDFKYTGIDISKQAIDLCKSKYFDRNKFKFFCLDILSEEINDNYDIIFSYGCIAYTKKPTVILSKLREKLKNNGILVSWIYTPNIFFIISLISLRLICKSFGNRFTNFIANTLVYFLKYLPVSSGVNLSNSSFDQCKETVMINISPKSLLLPTRKTALKWFLKSNFKLKYSSKSYNIFV